MHRDLREFLDLVAADALRVIAALGENDHTEPAGITGLVKDVELVVDTPDIGNADGLLPTRAVEMVLRIGHRPGRVELPGDLGELEIGLAGARFVSHSPENHRWVVAISSDEIAELSSRRPSPTAARANTLPGCEFGIDHESELVAGIEKGRALRVVGEPDIVAAVVLEQSGVGAMDLGGQCAAETRDGLVPVGPVEIDPGVVEVEPVPSAKLGAGDPEANANGVHRSGGVLQPSFRPVEVRVVG